MRARYWQLLLAAVLLIAACFLLIRNQIIVNPFDPNRNREQKETLKGVSLSPRGTESQDFTDFWVKADEAGDVVTWAGKWEELANPEGAPVVIMSVARQSGVAPVIITSIASQDTGAYSVPLDQQGRDRFKATVLSFVEEYKPPWFGLGVENNVLRAKNSRAYNDLKDLYRELYPQIKAKSPKTTVFTMWQFEQLIGQRGGLFGGKTDLTKTDWSLLSDFPETDAFAFSTYPFLVFKDPGDIPVDYYSQIRQHTSLPILFTETGWIRQGPKGWESSAQEQAAFVTILQERTVSLKPAMIVWSFLYDPKTAEPFSTTGLLEKSQNTSLPWERWKAL